MSFTDYLEAKVLDHVFGKTSAYTAPTNLYYALYTTLPDDTGSNGVEVSGGSYARVSVTNNATNFPNATAGNKANGNLITFAAPTANWGTVVGFGLCDASSGTNILAVFPLDQSKSIPSGSAAPTIAIGAATITMD